VVEPWLCGPSIGVAAVPLLISVLFWGWLWGLTGIILATPLTVCVAVLGKYVPQLEFLGVLLGSKPALGPAVSYYQRLLARDRHEAAEIIEEHLRAHSLEAVYDEVLVPALGLIKRGRENGETFARHEQFILQVTRELLETMSGRVPAPAGAGMARGRRRTASLDRLQKKSGPSASQPRPGPNELALLLFQHSLSNRAMRCRAHRHPEPPAELASLIERKEAALVFIAAVAPGGLVQTSYLCKRLRARFPRLKIVVGRWGLKGTLKKRGTACSVPEQTGSR